MLALGMLLRRGILCGRVGQCLPCCCAHTKRLSGWCAPPWYRRETRFHRAVQRTVRPLDWGAVVGSGQGGLSCHRRSRRCRSLGCRSLGCRSLGLSCEQAPVRRSCYCCMKRRKTSRIAPRHIRAGSNRVWCWGGRTSSKPTWARHMADGTGPWGICQLRVQLCIPLLLRRSRTRTPPCQHCLQFTPSSGPAFSLLRCSTESFGGGGPALMDCSFLVVAQRSGLERR
mmetsp:Transcript_135002/g.419514  ORF Transcript_135002/g.419514 Transcript_135002/m.419514 type:complete len:227 (-) Transcript_135002:144-824(-)